MGSILAVKADRLPKFKAALKAPVVFDYHGLERGGHNAVCRWLLKQYAPHNHMLITRAHDRTPGCAHYPGGWNTSLPDPEAVAISYKPDSDITTTFSHIPDGPVILCIRDFRNVIASRLKWQENNRRSQFHLDGYFKWNWTNYAEQTLGDADFFDGRCVPIIYDRWFQSRDYRIAIRDRLHDTFNWTPVSDVDYEFETVSPAGGGSSFDGMTLNNQARKMWVRKRYLEYQDNHVYQKLYTEDIQALNERLLSVEGP